MWTAQHSVENEPGAKGVKRQKNVDWEERKDRKQMREKSQWNHRWQSLSKIKIELGEIEQLRLIKTKSKNYEKCILQLDEFSVGNIDNNEYILNSRKMFYFSYIFRDLASLYNFARNLSISFMPRRFPLLYKSICVLDISVLLPVGWYNLRVSFLRRDRIHKFFV